MISMYCRNPEEFDLRSGLVFPVFQGFLPLNFDIDSGVRARDSLLGVPYQLFNI